MLIAAELACLTERGKEMRLTNAAGDDWGEVSMVGIKPTRLFAWMKDVTGLEKAQNIEPVPDYAGESAPRPGSRTTRSGQPAPTRWTTPATRPSCTWPRPAGEALFADAGAAGQQLKEADVLRWLAEHHAGLAKTAAERIATVVLPAK